MRSLGALKSIDNKTVFTHAGILFFVEQPSLFLPQSSVACVLYKGREKVNIIYRKEFNDDLISNIDNAIRFIERHINISAKIEGIQRQDIWEIPEVALQEAVVNAIVHRDYLEKGARVMVEIFDDKIVISNPGGLPKGLAEKDFGKYSLTRNATLASILLRINYIEKLGTGVHRINTALQEAHLRQATFEFDSFFSVIFNRQASGQESSEKSSEKILAIIEQTPTISAVKIAEMIGISPRAVEKHIAKLKEQGKIKRVGSAKGGHWQIMK